MKNHPQNHPLASMDPDEILSTAAWLRPLARALVRSSHDAEDLVQEALGSMAAGGGEIRDLRGYLAGTVRRMAAKMHRGNLRRADRETLRVQDSTVEVPPADHSLEAMDTMRVTLEEVASLPETQAKTIGLRYVEGLEVAAIAMRLDSTPSTVRSNLARGLESLRGRLDERFGDRSMWCTVLLPLALTKEELAAQAAALSQGSAGASSVTVPGVPTPTALPATGLATAATLLTSVMTLKFLLVAAVPAVLALSYFQLKGGDAPVQRADLPGLSRSAELEPLTPADFNGANQGTGSDELASAQVGAARSPVESQVVDARAASTGPATDGGTVTLSFQTIEQSPLHDFEVEFAPLDSDGQEISRAPGEERVAITDSAGLLTLDSLPSGTARLRLEAHEHYGHENYWAIMPDEIGLDHDAPLLVATGPTYSFRFEGATVPDGTPVIVEATGPDIAAQDQRKSPITYGAHPFARFNRWFSVENEVGPWTLEALSQDGLLRGLAEVHYGRGSFLELVPMTFTSTGRLRFETALTEDQQAAKQLTFPILRVSEEETDELTLRMTRRGEDLVADRGHLTAGTYRWSVPGQVDTHGDPIGGEVDVVLGEIVTVLVPPLGGPNLHRTSTIDASGAPGVDLTEWMCAAIDPGNLDNLVRMKPERAPELGPDMWKVQLGANPGPGWLYALTPENGFEVFPPAITLIAEGDIPTLRVTARAADIEVTLTVVDRDTGDVITDAYSLQAIHLDGFQISRVENGEDGLAPIKVSSARATSFIVGARDHKKTEVFFEPGNTEPNIRVELDRGWRNRVRVVNLSDIGFIIGAKVIVEGTEVGVTDETGSLWLDLDGPPDLIEVTVADDALELGISPFEREDGQPTDTIDGYTFAFKKAQ